MLQHQRTAAAVFHALGDASRRAIVNQLSLGSATVSVLAQPLDMTLAAVVQHIQVLERCGVVTTRKEGRTRTCRLAPDGLAVAERWLSDRRSLWERRLDRLGGVLDDVETSASPQGGKR